MSVQIEDEAMLILDNIQNQSYLATNVPPPSLENSIPIPIPQPYTHLYPQSSDRYFMIIGGSDDGCMVVEWV